MTHFHMDDQLCSSIPTTCPISSYPLCAYREEAIGSGETVNFVCNQVLSGRYLIIQLNHSDPLTLCEVEVYGGNN